jgi:undecaprenyl-diphosphatase
MNILQIAILAIVQGLAELLPVSSSAHVILAQRLMGIDSSAPEMTFLLVMLHTGTMFAALVYFWKRWKIILLDKKKSIPFLQSLAIATIATGILGFGLKLVIEKVILEHMFHHEKGEIEALFSVLPLIAAALFVVGLLILWAGLREKQSSSESITSTSALKIGLVQGLSLPFRGFSRSGATISTSLLLGISRWPAEEFSFALAVILTPPVVLLELKRLIHASAGSPLSLSTLLAPSLIGMVLSFGAGLVALKWLSAWLEKGRWQFFGFYCLVLALFTAALAIAR